MATKNVKKMYTKDERRRAMSAYPCTSVSFIKINNLDLLKSIVKEVKGKEPGEVINVLLREDAPENLKENVANFEKYGELGLENLAKILTALSECARLNKIVTLGQVRSHTGKIFALEVVNGNADVEEVVKTLHAKTEDIRNEAEQLREVS